MIDWSRYANFSAGEFTCKHCGAEGVQEELVRKLQQLRGLYGKPMVITSGYRCPDHPVERNKDRPGTHALGLAADIAVRGSDAHRLLKIALDLGFTGVGVQQKGSSRFIHLDIATNDSRFVRPMIWSY